MIEEIRDIQTRAGEMETFIVHPDRNGPHPVVFILMDALPLEVAGKVYQGETGLDHIKEIGSRT